MNPKSQTVEFTHSILRNRSNFWIRATIITSVLSIAAYFLANIAATAYVDSGPPTKPPAAIIAQAPPKNSESTAEPKNWFQWPCGIVTECQKPPELPPPDNPLTPVRTQPKPPRPPRPPAPAPAQPSPVAHNVTVVVQPTMPSASPSPAPTESEQPTPLPDTSPDPTSSGTPKPQDSAPPSPHITTPPPASPKTQHGTCGARPWTPPLQPTPVASNPDTTPNIEVTIVA
jgi:hypothetical protein